MKTKKTRTHRGKITPASHSKVTRELEHFAKVPTADQTLPAPSLLPYVFIESLHSCISVNLWCTSFCFTFRKLICSLCWLQISGCPWSYIKLLSVAAALWCFMQQTHRKVYTRETHHILIQKSKAYDDIILSLQRLLTETCASFGFYASISGTLIFGCFMHLPVLEAIISSRGFVMICVWFRPLWSIRTYSFNEDMVSWLVLSMSKNVEEFCRFWVYLLRNVNE